MLRSARGGQQDRAGVQRIFDLTNSIHIRLAPSENQSCAAQLETDTEHLSNSTNLSVVFVSLSGNKLFDYDQEH
jgi:hypothetical protein